jgi:hypothetical protein
MKQPTRKLDHKTANPPATTDRTLHIKWPWSMTWMEYVDEMLAYLQTRIGPGHPLHGKKLYVSAAGQAVQLMRSWFTAMPGEVVSCTGCWTTRDRKLIASRVDPRTIIQPATAAADDAHPLVDRPDRAGTGPAR